MEDLISYEVTVSYETKLGNLVATTVLSERIEGKNQLELVLEWLKAQGFQPEWRVYHAMSAAETIAQFTKKFHDFPRL